MLSAVELWCQFCRHKLQAEFTQINSRGWCCFQCCIDIRLFSPPPFLGLIGQPSFHLVVFRSVEKIQHNALVWRVGKDRLQGKTGIEWDIWASGQIVSLFSPRPFFQNDYRDGVVVFGFSALISSRVCSRQILSERAVLVLIQSRKNVVIKCNSSAISYARMLSVFCVWALVCVLTVCVCVVQGWTGSLHSIIISRLGSKVFLREY